MRCSMGRGVTNNNHVQYNTCELISFNDNSGTTFVGTLHGNIRFSERHAAGAGSDGAQLMVCGGYNPNFNTSVELKQFSSNATATNHGDMYAEAANAASGSDGTQVMIAGGQTPSSGDTKTCQLKAFASNATGTSQGELLVVRGYNTGASDGDNLFVTHNNPPASTSELKSFSSNATAVNHGGMILAQYGGAAASGTV